MVVQLVVPRNRGGPPTPLGRAGEPLLPASLRARWAGEQIPPSVLSRAGAPERLRYDQLTGRVHGRAEHIDALIEHVVALVQLRRKAIARVRVFEEVDPMTSVSGLGLSPRTHNALVRHGGQLLQGAKLPSLTWGRLLAITGVGVRSALEFALAVEGTRKRTGTKGSDRGDACSAALLRKLRRCARSQWARGLTLNDPRLGELARRNRETVAEACEAALNAAERGSFREAEQLAALVEGFTAIGEEIDSQGLELQLRRILACIADARGDRLKGLAARMGLAGSRLTLRGAGEIAGVSGARLQQLQAKLIDRAKHSRYLYMPAVDAAVRSLTSASPIRVEDAGRHLKSQGISHGQVDIAVFVGEWLPMLGRRGLEVVEHGGSDWIIRPELGTAAHQLEVAGYFPSETEKQIRGVAGRLCRSVGLASHRWVAEELQIGLDVETIRAVRRVIRRAKTFEFLDRTWFWDPSVPPGFNRLDNTVRKVLSVSPTVPLAELVDALDRVYRQGRLPRLPPAEIVALFLAAHSSFSFTDGQVTAQAPFNADNELGQTERIFVEVLSSVPGGVLDREALRRACVERGMNVATFSQYTSFSPILTQPGRNVWALRGRSVDESAVQRLGVTRKRRRRSATVTRTADGQLVVTWMITGSESSVFSIPIAERHGYVNRDYTASGADGTTVGTIHVDEDGTSWGYGPFVRITNAARGDRIIASFDRRGRTVSLEIERGADRPWVGDLGNCFLHDESWALRLYVDDDLLSGASWRIPLSLADAIGIPQGNLRVPLRNDETTVIALDRDDGACTGSSLKTVLRAIEARRDDRVFLDLDPNWFDVRRRDPAKVNGDPLDELLSSAGVELPAESSDHTWNALCRALGGSSTGGREEVEERLRQRGDQVGIGLLQRSRSVPAARVDDWPRAWELLAELDADASSFSIRNGAGAVRRAVGVSAPSAVVASGVIVDNRGIVWADDGRLNASPFTLTSLDGVTPSATDAAWIRWARAEHYARRSSLSGNTWLIKPNEGQWIVDGDVFPDLRDALEAVPPVKSEPVPPTVAESAPYSSNAFAFRMIVGGLLRNGLTTLRSDADWGFTAEFDDGRLRHGVGLADLAL